MSAGIIEALYVRLEVLEREVAALKKPVAGLVTIKEYARRDSIGTSTVRAAIRDGRLKAVRIGRAVRIPSDAEIAKPVVPERTDSPSVRADRILGLAGGQR